MSLHTRLAPLLIFGAVVFATLIQFSVSRSCVPSAPWQSISDSNLAWHTQDEERMTLAALSRIPVAWYRDTLHPNAIIREVDILRRVQKQNKKILLVINPEPPYYSEPSAKYAGQLFKTLCGWGTGNVPLSGVDLRLLKENLQRDLSILKQGGIKVDAFEIGNELDWVCFNTDLPLNEDAGNVEENALHTYAEIYARFFKTVSAVIKQSNLYPEAQILTFGTANTMETIPSRSIFHPGRLIAVMSHLDGINYLNSVDRIAVHLYPDIHHPEMIESALRTFITDTHSDKPLWITEWGYHNSVFHEGAGKTRLNAFHEFYNAVQQSSVRVENMFMFSLAAPDFSLIDPKGELLPEGTFFSEIQSCP